MKRYIVASLVAGMLFGAQSALARVELTAVPRGADDLESISRMFAKESQPAAMITAVPVAADDFVYRYNGTLSEKRIDVDTNTASNPFPPSAD